MKRVGLSQDREFIIAQCTPQGSGAIAVIRLCGDNLFSSHLPWVKLSKNVQSHELDSHTIHYGQVIDPENKEAIDQVLFLIMHAPKTFTGQDTLEISCHNNQMIIQKIIDVVCRYGARQALPGEFSKRSVLNGKIDLLQAESINELIHANTQEALKRSLSQLSGSFSHCIADVQKKLVELISLVEASFEFLDEEQRDFNFHERVCRQLQSLYNNVLRIEGTFSAYEQIRQGIKIALIGVTNAGKSTLFNALVRQDRAIVTDIEGTTRDSIESTVYRAGSYLQLVDTAGLRLTDDVIEQAGIERSRKQALQADVILLVIDSTRSIDDQIKEAEYEWLKPLLNRVILVVNKIDLVENPVTLSHSWFNGCPLLSVSAQKNQGVVELESAIELQIKMLHERMESPFLLNKRQWQLVSSCRQELNVVLEQLEHDESYEIIAYHLKKVLEMLGSLTGRDATEQVFDKVFSSFCVGK